LAVEENSPKSGSFGIDNIAYVYWFRDFILCYLDFEPIMLL